MTRGKAFAALVNIGPEHIGQYRDSASRTRPYTDGCRADTVVWRGVIICTPRCHSDPEVLFLANSKTLLPWRRQEQVSPISESQLRTGGKMSMMTLETQLPILLTEQRSLHPDLDDLYGRIQVAASNKWAINLCERQLEHLVMVPSLAGFGTSWHWLLKNCRKLHALLSMVIGSFWNSTKLLWLTNLRILRGPDLRLGWILWSTQVWQLLFPSSLVVSNIVCCI